MKTFTKRIASLVIVAAYVFTLLVGVIVFIPQRVFADSVTEVSSSQYFYDNLTYTDQDGQEQEYVLAKTFYRAIGDMHKNGDFKDGVVDYSLTDNKLATSEMIEAWVVDGDVTIPKAFSAARDAYYMDHSELFYIDIYKLTISAASDGSTYKAYIDSGREANLYAVGEFTSEAEVDTALTAYYAKIDTIVNYAKTEANKDTYGTDKKVLQARYANQYIATHTEYDDISAVNSAITTASAPQTAYGALVNGTAVCNGYSRAFKAIMDKLDIPCIVVGGYSIAKGTDGEYTEVGEAHAWNYVWFETPASVKDDEDGGIATQADAIEGAWYGYDVTWNSTGNNVNSYIDMGAFAMLKEHSPDGEISTSGYLVKYPELSNYAYGCKTDSNGIVYSFNYVAESDTPELGEIVMVRVSVNYNGKGAIKLFEEDKLRIIYRWSYAGEGGVSLWEPWIDLYAEIKEGPFGEQGWGGPALFTDSGFETEFFFYSQVLYVQFAVLDGSENGTKPDAAYYSGYDNILTIYDTDTDLGEYVVALSDIAESDAYLKYVPAPHVVASSPDHKQVNMISQSWAVPGTNQMDDKYAFDVYVTYHEPLHILNENEPIGISFTSAYLYGTRNNVEDFARCIPLTDNDGNVKKDAQGNDIYVELVAGNIETDDKGKKVFVASENGELNTLHFKFCPSLMYEHNGMHYYFTYSNVGSAYVNYKADGSEYISDKTPNVLPLRFFREYIACNKCLPNGRMLLDCVAQPTLLSNTDLSEVGFKDENDNYFSAGQRSQMMLVVEKPSEEEEATMNELLEASEEINVKAEDIKAAETYEINLQICGRYTYIPVGSYVKVALGFPEGYGPDDEGVTFKIYHYVRERNGGPIVRVEEIPCVVTRFGIVATIPSFSPFMIVAVDSSKATTKNIYASVDGNGGKLNNADGQIRTLKEGESYTYTIAPDSGYQIYRVTLNGKDVTSKVADGKLTVAYNELDFDNEIEIKYIADGAVKRLAAKDMQIVEPVKVIVATDGETSVVAGTGGKVDMSAFDVPDDTPNGDNNDNNNNKPNGDNNGAPDVGLIIGIVVGVVVVVTACVIAVMVIRNKKKNED